MLKTLALYSFCNTFSTVWGTLCLAHGLRRYSRTSRWWQVYDEDVTIDSLYRYLALGVQKRLFQLSIQKPWCLDSLSDTYDIEGFSETHGLPPHNFSQSATS